MEIDGKNVLVLGGGGMVGTAVCRELLAHEPALLVVAARHEEKARDATESLKADFSALADRIVPVWGDVFTRSEWQGLGADLRAHVLSDREKRRRLIADVLDPLDEGILQSSYLYRMVLGDVPGLDGKRARVVIDCMNTATAVSYQDIYSLSRRLFDLSDKPAPGVDWPMEVETILAALSLPQLVRHVQILYEAMRQAGTAAYVKVGTTGTGGMGFNIPYTHGEEKPSRLLLTKASMAGAQSLLTFLMARTPDGPGLVREMKPAALIGWHRIGHGPIRRHSEEIPLFDCPPSDAVPIGDAANLVPEGDFGRACGESLAGVFIDTGENGVFTADEFTAITSLGQMEMVTPEDIARNVVGELLGGNTGRDVVAALDSAVMGPSYVGGYLRHSALDELRRLEAEHGQGVAFEILGPPHLSKLLYEAYLLQTVAGSVPAVIEAEAARLADNLARRVVEDESLRSRILSIGAPILLPDGKRLLRGPTIKSVDAHHGWVDLTPANVLKWQDRLAAISRTAAIGKGESSSRSGRIIEAAGGKGFFDIGEIVGWVLRHEDNGERAKT